MLTTIAVNNGLVKVMKVLVFVPLISILCAVFERFMCLHLGRGRVGRIAGATIRRCATRRVTSVSKGYGGR